MADKSDLAEFEPVKIKQNRGPTLEFQGKLLCSTDWDARENLMRLELWMTKGGALIPVTRSVSFSDKRDLVSAAVIEPQTTSKLEERDGETWCTGYIILNEQEMRFACLDFWDWTDRARSMVREQLGWSLKQQVA
jgi:hypothetical protein